MREMTIIRFLVGASLMITGLASFLTIFHALLVGLSAGQYALEKEQLWFFMKATGLLPWMAINGLMYIGGLLLIVSTTKKDILRR